MTLTTDRTDVDTPGGRMAHVPPPLPPSRGPLTRWLFHHLEHGSPPSPLPAVPGDVDPATDDDMQLALYCIYELSYRGFRTVDPVMESDQWVLTLKRQLASQFEAGLRARVTPVAAVVGRSVDLSALIDAACGPSLSEHLLSCRNLGRFREFMVHRSAYQLKEADPHSWVIPRLAAGARKAAFLEIQVDEYGGGRPGRSHADLFAAAMDAAGLDATYGAHIHRLPGVTLATCNLVSLLGSERRLSAAALGHLAAFEMTSVEPMARYALASDMLGLPRTARHFYDVHVEADDHHGRLASEVLVGGDLCADGIDPFEVAFGAAALLHVEGQFTRHLLRRWSANQSSFHCGWVDPAKETCT